MTELTAIDLTEIKRLTFSNFVASLKKLGKVSIKSVLYSDKDIMPDIGRNKGKQFIIVQMPDREVRIGFTLFSKAVLQSGNEKTITPINEEAKEAFITEFKTGDLGTAFATVEKAFLNKKASQEKKWDVPIPDLSFQSILSGDMLD